MSARMLMSLACLGVALAAHGFGADAKAAKPPAFPESPLARCVPVEVGAAANDCVWSTR